MTDTTPAIYRVRLTVMEHIFFASREVGNRYETEAVIGNYALTYALGFCQAPYSCGGPPRYKQDLAPLNEQGIYVTPGSFDLTTLRFVFSQFNGQTDTFYSRFDQNAISTDRNKKARAANFPQTGKIRLIGQGSIAQCYVINYHEAETPLHRPDYIRLGKFNSKVRLEWNRLELAQHTPTQGEHPCAYSLNVVDLPPELVQTLRAFTLVNIYPAPLATQSRLTGSFWEARDATGVSHFIPAGLRYGIETLP